MKKYTIPDGGDWNLMLKYNKNINFEKIKEFYKKYGYDIDFEYELEENMFISIWKKENEKINIASEDMTLDDEFKEEMLDDSKEDKETNDIVKEIDSLYLFDTRNKEESILVLLLGLYLSQQTDTILFDTYNGIFVLPQKIKEIILNEKNIEENEEEQRKKEQEQINKKVERNCKKIINSLELLLNEKERKKTIELLDKYMSEMKRCLITTENSQQIKETIIKCKNFADENDIKELYEISKQWQLDIFLRFSKN